MIAYLKGRILECSATDVILDVNGVGYAVHISLGTFEQISSLAETELFIKTIVREDAITLFGFVDKEEKAMFELLIGITGIGPKSALGVLSGIRPKELRAAIYNGDISRIVAVPGIGKKTAERIVLELRGKIDGLSISGADSGSTIRSEALAALTVLGYNQKVAERTVREILEINPSVGLEELLKVSLRKMTN